MNQNRFFTYFFFLICSAITMQVSGAVQGAEQIALFTIPKTGSNMLCKLISELTGRRPTWPPHRVNWKTHYWWEHPRNGNIGNYLNGRIKIIGTYRDPRDQIISCVRWAFKCNHLRTPDKTVQQVALEMLQNYGAAYRSNFGAPFANYAGARTLDAMYAPVMQWEKYPQVLMVYFENLVGPRGGGSREVQLDEIRRIANHLEVELSQERLEEIADNLFGGTSTFMSGQIGTWRQYFGPEHVDLIKKSCGSTLVRLGYERDENWTYL